MAAARFRNPTSVTKRETSRAQLDEKERQIKELQGALNAQFAAKERQIADLTAKVTAQHQEMLAMQLRMSALYTELLATQNENFSLKSANRVSGPSSIANDLKNAVMEWFRQASLKYHPDRGGSTQAMMSVNDVLERLTKVLQQYGA
jgi:hypothetical protein